MINAFDTIILAGGTGSRLRDVVNDRPKCLAEINGRPFIYYLLDQLSDNGIDNVILSTGYRAEQIEQALGTTYQKMNLRYSREDHPLGTGGGLKKALGLTRHQHVVVMNGDSFLDFNYRDFLHWFDSARMRAGLAAVWQPNCNRFGELEIDDQGLILAFREKSPTPRAGWINAGIYLLDRSLLENMPQETFSLERELFPHLIGDGFFARNYHGNFIDIGVPDSYRNAAEFFARQVTE